MVEFRHLYGAVYVLENIKAGRVKVGMTIGDVRSRLKEVDQKWSSRKATCQICGSRRLTSNHGRMPQHVVSGRQCPGGNAPPLEKDVSLAQSQLKHLEATLSELSGSEKGSVTRQINTLKKRIALFQDFVQPVGIWQFNTAFYTNSAEQVELLAHEILADHLDRQAPIGEVFCCSVSEATAAVESALNQLGLLASVRKETRDDTTSAEFGECLICGKNLTQRGSCPDCTQRLFGA